MFISDIFMYMERGRGVKPSGKLLAGAGGGRDAGAGQGGQKAATAMIQRQVPYRKT